MLKYLLKGAHITQGPKELRIEEKRPFILARDPS